MKLLRAFVASALCIVGTWNFYCHALCDDRYLPFVPVKLVRLESRPSRLWVNGFFTQATGAYDCSGEKITTFADLFGEYDQYKLELAMQKAGLNNTLFLDEWLKTSSQSIAWIMGGNLQGQGLSFGWEEQFQKHFALGVQSSFIHLYGDRTFRLTERALKDLNIILRDGSELDGQLLDLDHARRYANDVLGLQAPIFEASSFGDTSFYTRFNYAIDYILKCRCIDASFLIGGIIPSALKRDICNPASIPFGGDGHWGMMFEADLQAELKEDWFAGCMGQIIHRFSRTARRRMPAGHEQPLWGVLVGDAKINPGETYVVSPYVALEDMQDGWGGMIRYTMIWHKKDSWYDARTDCSIVPQLFELRQRSDWGAEYLSFCAIYTGYKGVFTSQYAPRFYANFDLPVSFLCAKSIPKTYRFTLGLEFNY